MHPLLALEFDPNRFLDERVHKVCSMLLIFVVLLSIFIVSNPQPLYFFALQRRYEFSFDDNCAK